MYFPILPNYMNTSYNQAIFSSYSDCLFSFAVNNKDSE